MKLEKITVNIMEWLLDKQNPDGTWSGENEPSHIFLTTNRVANILLYVGYSVDSLEIRRAIEWLKTQLGNSDIPFEDRVNSLETFILADEKDTVGELLSLTVAYINRHDSYQKKLFPIFVLDLYTRFDLPIETHIIEKITIWLISQYDNNGTIDRNVPLTSYALVVLSVLPKVKENEEILSKNLCWLKDNWRDIDGKGWELSIATNIYVVLDFIRNDYYGNIEWEEKIRSTIKWVISQLHENCYMPNDSEFAYRVRNSYYTTSLSLYLLHTWIWKQSGAKHIPVLGLAERMRERIRDLENTLNSVEIKYTKARKLKSSYPFLIGLGLGVLLALLLSNLLHPTSSNFVNATHIGAGIVSLLIVIIFEIKRILHKRSE